VTLAVNVHPSGRRGWVVGTPDDLEKLANAVRQAVDYGPVATQSSELLARLTIFFAGNGLQVVGSDDHRMRLAAEIEHVAEAVRTSGEARLVDLMPETTAWLDQVSPEVVLRGEPAGVATSREVPGSPG
jgi:hypothetical protein